MAYNTVEVMNMSKLNERLSDLFRENRVQTYRCDVDELIGDLPISPSMYPEILRKADRISRGEYTIQISATREAPHRVVCGINEALALKLLHTQSIEFIPVSLSETQILRYRFDEIPDFEFRCNLIQQYAVQHPDFDRIVLAKSLSISTIALAKFLTYAPKDPEVG